MDNLLKKEEKPYLFALFIVFLVYLSFELFAFGFNLGKERFTHKANLNMRVFSK
ncbi:hypothetical protein [Pedobacter frigiditerrae]|uniref:hypothetical protein n=1 Tax=Pedobacter frigiditerrae TaxID=2530452 RepID=UPI00292D6C43|nr:hypothetical protein [Pedobacter frigiditerrae]